MKPVSPRWILIAALPLAALAILAASFVFRQPPADDDKRERAKIEQLVQEEREAREASNPELLLHRLRPLYAGTPAAKAEETRKNLVKLGDAALPSLLSSIRNPNEPLAMRLDLVAVVGDNRTEKAQELLAQLAGDRSNPASVRSLAVTRIDPEEYPGGFAVLHRILRDEADFGTRNQVLKSLARSRTPDATRVLLDACSSDADTNVRLQAIDSLGERLPSEGVIEALQRAILNDQSENARILAVTRLKKSNDPRVHTFFQECAGRQDLPIPVRAAMR